ncbi:hypothetical protein [Kitasatospora viridis]|uniref:Uncharacterized protein n=1 Tax=Kitasatospora viridis TaxID=281105 RepID=A0A561UH58_9ACTN|nr:hypothetical protein [Kitasatospora viridis]TWF98691.1 hypothetical protein FHX73_112512 [Kitasatospora viridis]
MSRQSYPLPDVLRVLAELVAWTAFPWAMGRISLWLALASLVLLIGVPAVLATPGDNGKTNVPVPIPGWGTILLVLMELGAAVAGGWLVLPAWAAVPVTLLALACVVTEQPRWRRLLGG